MERGNIGAPSLVQGTLVGMGSNSIICRGVQGMAAWCGEAAWAGGSTGIGLRILPKVSP